MNKLFLFLFSVLPLFSMAQCPDTLRLINFPCCISGADWSEEEQQLYIVSDLKNKVYLATISRQERSITVTDSLSLSGAPHSHGVEGVRKAKDAFYFVYEKDQITNNQLSAYAYITKGVPGENKTIAITHTHHIAGLPANKGLEGIALSSDQQTVWVAHESFKTLQNSSDSVQILALDTALNMRQQLWFSLSSASYFGPNLPAYLDDGISDIMSLNDTVYVLERGWGKYKGLGELFIQVYKLKPGNWSSPQLLHRFQTSIGDGPCLDNFEAMCYLPMFHQLLLLSDNNNSRRQRTMARLLAP